MKLNILFGLVFISSIAAAETVNILNWADYIDPELLEKFTNETGISVNYVEFPDVLDFNRIYSESSEGTFDVMITSSDDASVLAKTGRLLAIDKSQAPNLATIGIAATENLKTYDPTSQYMVEYMSGSVGLALNMTKLNLIFPNGFPTNLDLIFNEKYLGDSELCGISVIDSPTDVIALWQKYSGADPTVFPKSASRAVKNGLASAIPHYGSLNSDDYIERLSNGSLCIALGYSGDIFQAIQDAPLNGVTDEIRFYSLTEGNLVFFDPLVIPVGANTEAAYKFIDFIYDPKNAAKNTEYTFYKTPVKDAQLHMDAEVRTNEAIYPPKEALNNQLILPNFTDSELKGMYRAWHVIKCRTGQTCSMPITLSAGFPLSLYYGEN
jgi:putrescine transport system substrate-binding protein